jgi:transposase
MIDMLKRHEVQVLRRAGHTWKAIAVLTGVSARTVRRIAAEDAITTIDNAGERARRHVGRPSTADAYRDVLLQALTEEPSLRSVELLHRARQAGYAGGKSAVYALAQTLRVHVTAPLVRFEGLPGEFSQHDFGEVRVRYQDGAEAVVHFFASRLKYSRWAEVTLVPDEQVETLVRTLVDHLAAFGGIPLVAVFDRPKTVALKWGRDGVVTEWNPTFAGVALDLGIGVEVCWPYRPQEKGSVENLVGWVKGSFFKQRRFLDRADLAQQLREWLTETNTVRPSRATGVPPAQRILEERPRLRPVKIAPADLALRIPVSVSPMGVVIHDGHPYSMPPEAIGLPGTLYLYREHVRIVAGASAPSTRGNSNRARARSCPSIAPSAWRRCRGNARAAICSGSICSISARRRWPISPSSRIGVLRSGFTTSSSCTRCSKRMATPHCAAPSSAASPTRPSARSTSRTISANARRACPSIRQTTGCRP